MKVNQIVGEHKKGYKANIYRRKKVIAPQSTEIKPVGINEAPGDMELLNQVNALKQSNPKFAAELQAKNLQLVRGMGPDSQRHNAQVMQQYRQLVQKYSATPVEEELPGQMVGKVSAVDPSQGTVTIQSPSGENKTVQQSQLAPGENNKLTMQTPKIQPGMEVDAEKTFESLADIKKLSGL